MMMRTTLTLDTDVARKLREAMHELKRPLRQLVNEFLRIGLTVRAGSASPQKFQIKSKVMGHATDQDYDNIGALLEQLDGPTRV